LSGFEKVDRIELSAINDTAQWKLPAKTNRTRRRSTIFA